MVVYIVQVMNNMSRTLHYHNLESGKEISLKPKTQKYENNGWIPSSKYSEDAIPFRHSNHINVLPKNGYKSGPIVEISDDDWKFRIVGPVSYTNERAEVRYGDLGRNDKYILRLDEVHDGKITNVGLTFHKYEDKYKVTADYIATQLIQQLAPVVALVLMAIFI